MSKELDRLYKIIDEINTGVAELETRLVGATREWIYSEHKEFAIMKIGDKWRICLQREVWTPIGECTIEEKIKFASVSYPFMNAYLHQARRKTLETVKKAEDGLAMLKGILKELQGGQS